MKHVTNPIREALSPACMPYEAPTLETVELLDETAQGDSSLPDEPGDPF